MFDKLAPWELEEKFKDLPIVTQDDIGQAFATFLATQGYMAERRDNFRELKSKYEAISDKLAELESTVRCFTEDREIKIPISKELCSREEYEDTVEHLEELRRFIDDVKPCLDWVNKNLTDYDVDVDKLDETHEE